MTGPTSIGEMQTLTKSDFLRVCECPGYAWLARYEPHRLPAPEASTLAQLAAGTAIGELARQRFPGGFLIDTTDPDAALADTARAISRGASILYEAAAQSPTGLFARADILIRDANDLWRMVEIKDSMAEPGDIRPIADRYLKDVTFQAIAFTDAGYDIAGVSVLHVNRGYRRRGDIRVEELFALTDLTDQVGSALDRVWDEIVAAMEILSDVDRAADCACNRRTKSNRCAAFSVLHPDIPLVDTVYDLGVQERKLRQVLDLGIIHLKDWPASVTISAKQRARVEMAKSGRATTDTRFLADFLAGMVYPLTFLDYETFQATVPPFEGSSPFAQVPFQYSMHVIAEDGRRTHAEFLWTERGTDPVPALIAKLEADLPEHGTIVSWNSAFEEGRNREMGERYPASAPFFARVNARMVDLGDVVKDGGWLDPSFGGSWSIKKVLPVAAPDLRYDTLAIGNGGLAAEQWMRCCVGDESAEISEAEREEIFADLRTYCHQDTLAMVRIWEHVRMLAGVV